MISKWIKSRNISAKTINFIEENIEVNLVFDSGFLNMTLKIQTTKENIDKME